MPNVQRGERGVLDLKLSAPGLESLEFIATELHPRAEQLFSGAWSACYTTMFGMAAQLKKVTLPPDYSVDIQVNIGQTGAAWFLGAQFTIRVPGLERKSSRQSRSWPIRSARTRSLCTATSRSA